MSFSQYEIGGPDGAIDTAGFMRMIGAQCPSDIERLLVEDPRFPKPQAPILGEGWIWCRKAAKAYVKLLRADRKAARRKARFIAGDHVKNSPQNRVAGYTPKYTRESPEAPTKWRETAFYVYVISTGVRIIQGTYTKIGIANNPEGRIASIRSSCPVPLRVFGVFGPMDRFSAGTIEAAAHAKLSARHIHGEYPDEIVERIREALEGPFEIVPRDPAEFAKWLAGATQNVTNGGFSASPDEALAAVREVEFFE